MTKHLCTKIFFWLRWHSSVFFTTAVLIVLLMPVRWSAAKRKPVLDCQHENCRYLSGQTSTSGQRNRYEVDHKAILISLSRKTRNKPYNSLSMICFGAAVLESPALPRANITIYLSVVSLNECPLPAKNSIADTLSALNVKLVNSKELAPNQTISTNLMLFEIPPIPPLHARHFTNLESLDHLTITVNRTTRAYPEPGFLDPLQSLQTLYATNLALSSGDLDVVSRSLFHLDMMNVSVDGLPKTLCLSTTLKYIFLHSTRAMNARCVGPAVRELNLSSPATKLKLTDAPFLLTFELENWTELNPRPLTRCDRLHTLRLTTPMLLTLPEGWLANCSRLNKLELRYARNLTTLPKILVNTSTFLNMSFSQGALESLPKDFLRYAPNLQDLQLDGNRLLTLASFMFLPTRLMVLNLSSNNLDSDAIDVLAPLEYLGELNLAYNPRIGDLCKEDHSSVIRNSKKLRILNLKGTSVNRICRDWRENMTFLRMLDLSDTNVTQLSYEDLQFNRTFKSEVLLLGAPVIVVEVTRDCFSNLSRQLLAPTEASNVSVRIDAHLACDCRMYWTRRVLEFHVFNYVSELSCVGGEKLSDMRPEDMWCTATNACSAFNHLPEKCACFWRPDEEPHTEQQLVRVRCEGAAMHRIPRPAPASPPRSYELLLQNNLIDHLDVGDLHDDIKGLDLRNNSLSRVDGVTAARLVHLKGVLRLAGNPLKCDCHAAPLLSALHRRAALLRDTDLFNASCGDGSALHKASIVECVPTVITSPAVPSVTKYTIMSAVPTSMTALSMPSAESSVITSPIMTSVAPTTMKPPTTLLAVTSGLVVFLTFTLVAVITLMSRNRRFFAQALLNRWGCLWRGNESAADEGRPYDVFLTFSHADEAVACEVVARLEARYRLCVHYRDWIPGRLITEQIVESVERSRRTVALVSRHFIASTWARAEFREAHAAALRDPSHRLVVVLLEEPQALPLDAQLRRYIRTNTYLRWGDPWFWDKLQVALPPPRRPPYTQSEPASDVALVALPRPLLTTTLSPAPDES